MLTHLRLPDLSSLTAVFALESIKGFGPQKFRELREHGLQPKDVLENPGLLPTKGKRGDAFRADLDHLMAAGVAAFKARAERQLERAQQHHAHIVLQHDPEYPRNLWASNNPVPVLYVRGDVGLLSANRAVACVGSREIGGVYAARQRDFAAYAAKEHYVVVSGFAMGADSIAHRAARDTEGGTICVMPCGLDRPFPPENRELWREFNEYPLAVMLSEFPFGTAAATLTLRKRNKTIVGLALGVLVGQSSAKGGAMNAFRFALEQRKPVASFAPDATEATAGNQMIIEHESGTGFEADRPDEAAWGTWLSRLSSST